MKIKDIFINEKDPKTVPIDWHLERFRNWRLIELLSTDWTQLEDAPADKIAFAKYRQDLRDLTKIDDFANADLPTRPQ